jgi:hypothetical protein
MNISALLNDLALNRLEIFDLDGHNLGTILFNIDPTS